MFQRDKLRVNRGNNDDNKLTRINKNIGIGNKNFLDVNRNTFKRFRPRNKEQLLALDLAETLNDYPNLPLYLFLL